MTINGERIPSPEGDIRAVALDVVPTDLLEAIEVSKALTPDMDADAIGGAVNLVTKAAPAQPLVFGTVAGGVAPVRFQTVRAGHGNHGRVRGELPLDALEPVQWHAAVRVHIGQEVALGRMARRLARRHEPAHRFVHHAHAGHRPGDLPGPIRAGVVNDEHLVGAARLRQAGSAGRARGSAPRCRRTQRL
jgi:hypothetical protein